MSYIKTNKGLILILSFALLIRLIYLVIVSPPVTWADAELYDKIAKNLIQGEGYAVTDGEPTAAREPGYIMDVLVPLYLVFGPSLVAVQTVQIILSLIVIFGVYRITESAVNRRAAWIAAFILSIHPPSIIYVGEILTENFYTFILFLGLWFLWRNLEKNPQGSWQFVWVGGVLGIATLTRFNTALIFLPLIAALGVGYKFLGIKWAFKKISWVIIGMAIVVSPWVVRNYIQFDALLPGRFGSGVMVWVGSYQPWDGDWLYHPVSSNEFNFSEEIKNLSLTEQEAYFLEKAKENIKNDPVGVAWLWIKKPFKILFIEEIGTYLNSEKISQYPNLTFLERWKNELAAFRMILQITHITVILIAGWGCIKLFKKNKKLACILIICIGYYLTTYMPFNAVPRYLIPVVPYLAILFGTGMDDRLIPLKIRNSLK